MLYNVRTIAMHPIMLCSYIVLHHITSYHQDILFMCRLGFSRYSRSPGVPVAAVAVAVATAMNVRNVLHYLAPGLMWGSVPDLSRVWRRNATANTTNNTNINTK